MDAYVNGRQAIPDEKSPWHCAVRNKTKKTSGLEGDLERRSTPRILKEPPSRRTRLPPPPNKAIQAHSQKGRRHRRRLNSNNDKNRVAAELVERMSYH